MQQLDSIGQAGAESKAAMPCFQLKRDREQYMKDVATCLDALAAGESYEVSPVEFGGFKSSTYACAEYCQPQREVDQDFVRHAAS